MYYCFSTEGVSYIIASGTYLYNSVFSTTDNLAHSCPSRSIPVEKKKYGDYQNFSFDAKGKMIPSICFKLPGGFAADILSFSIFGSSSIGKSLHFYYEPTNIDIGGASNVDNSDIDENVSDEEVFKQLRKQILDKQKNS